MCGRLQVSKIRLWRQGEKRGRDIPGMRMSAPVGAGGFRLRRKISAGTEAALQTSGKRDCRRVRSGVTGGIMVDFKKRIIAPSLLAASLAVSVGPDVLLELAAPDRAVPWSADQGSFTTLAMPTLLSQREK